MIPKVIHYCWFGRGQLPDTAVKCIESWKKYCPDYDIREWNEDNFLYLNYQYTTKAYDAKKYAFVSDYVRFNIIERYGGIYLDVDVELVKGLDEFLVNDLFLGRQDKGDVNPGLIMGGIPQHWFLKKVLSYYDTHDFDVTNLNENVVTITTNLLCECGMTKEDINTVIKDVHVFSSQYFCPLSYLTGYLRLTDKTVSIHHFDGSWLTDEDKNRHEMLSMYLRLFGEKFGMMIWIFKYSVKDVGLARTISKVLKKCFNK